MATSKQITSTRARLSYKVYPVGSKAYASLYHHKRLVAADLEITDAAEICKAFNNYKFKLSLEREENDLAKKRKGTGRK